MTFPRQTLDGDALNSLIAKMAGAPAQSPAVSPNLGSGAGFEGHPLHLQIKLQREFGELSGVADPYYRLHGGMSGATSLIGGAEIINFASYDYLGLNGHPEILEAAGRANRDYGTSVSASRISAGEREPHRALERALASHYRADDCVAFVSGHAGAVSTIATLMGPRDLILHDSLIHNCIVMGAQLSGAARRVFPHNDLVALDAILAAERGKFKRVMIVSEGLFSMDGDGPDLKALIRIKRQYDASLMIDDAHGLGVLGARGGGLFEHQGVDPAGVDLWLGTLSKALVSCGGYVASSRPVIDILKYNAPGFVYSVGMPASAAAAAATALEIIAREPERVERLQANSRRFQALATECGLDTGAAWGAGIIPVFIGGSLETALASQDLLSRGVNAFPILPPGVPEKTARLRFFINSSHSDEHLRAAAEATRAAVRLHAPSSIRAPAGAAPPRAVTRTYPGGRP